MDLKMLTDDEVALSARALSIHRVSLRKKLGRMRPGSSEHAQALQEVVAATNLIAKLNQADLVRLGAA